MTNEFTALCAQYYRLTTRFEMAYKRYKNLSDNAPLYSGQHSINELNDLMSYSRTLETARTKGAKIFKDLTETAQTIVAIMRSFGIPPRTVLLGEIPGEIEFELWTHETGGVVINKLRDLPKEPENPNMIYIKCWNGNKSEDDD
jgi:hypothetical protein